MQELDARRAIGFAEDGLRVPGTSAQTRALCTSWAALGRALARDRTACERRLEAAHGLVRHDGSPAPSWAGGFPITPVYVHAAEARCWLWLQPSKSVSLYDTLVLEWPRDRMRTSGLHQARLALACAAAGERDRASAEGRKALAIARATKSSLIGRELKRLGETLRAA
jgi:hypothetical protein